jgi:ADP-heptose:LPS heptosyltransferase
MNVVIFKFNHLGDNVVFLPVVQALRALRPAWRLTLLTTPGEAPLYSSVLPHADLWTAEKQRFDKCWRRPWALAAWWLRLRARRAQACLVSFDQANTAHVLARHSGAAVRIGGNLAHIRFSHTLTHEVPMPADGCPATWHWAMGRALVRAVDGAAHDWPDRPPPPDLRHLVGPALAPTSRPRVVIHAGASRELNRWPTARFAAVAESLAVDHDVVWIDRAETAAQPLHARVRRVAAPALRDLATLVAGANLFLGNNSGPMHVANALGVRGVVVTGSSALGWDPYWHRDRWRVLRHPSLPCAPCESADKMLPGCALTSDHLACLRHWTATAVEAACRRALAG